MVQASRVRRGSARRRVCGVWRGGLANRRASGGPKARLAARRAALDLIKQHNSLAHFACGLNDVGVISVVEIDIGC